MQLGGPVNTRVHGYLMAAAAAVALFGWCGAAPHARRACELARRTTA